MDVEILLANDKITALCQTKMPPLSIISNVTNNKNELGKAARLASFQNAQLQSTLIVLEFDHPYLLFYLSCYLNLLFMF